MQDRLTEYSLLVTIIGTLFAVFGLVLTYIGYFKYKQADKHIDTAINKKLEEFEVTLADRLDQIQNAQSKLNASYAASEDKDYDKAIELINQAIIIYPRLYNLYNTLGYAYLDKNQVFPAIDAFKRAVEIRPNDAVSYNDLARCYALSNMSEMAIKALGKALKLDSNKIIPYLDSDIAFKDLKKDIRYKKLVSKYMRLNLR